MRVADAARAATPRSASWLNCGLWRERGTVRTSISWVTRWARSSSRNASIGRVEWPTVSTLHGTPAFSGFMSISGWQT